MARDMTRQQFRTAIARRGWRHELLWIVGTGKDGRTTGVGVITDMRGRVLRRATLAKAIRELRDATDTTTNLMETDDE